MIRRWALTAISPSGGFVHQVLYRTATAVRRANDTIRTLLALAHVVSVDENPTDRPEAKYLLVACTELDTWFILGDRALETSKEFILPDP